MLEGGYDLPFPDDEDTEYECPNCGSVIKGNEKVDWIDKREEAK